MTPPEIDATQMPSQRWTIVGQPSIRHRTASSLPDAPRPPESPTLSDAAVWYSTVSLEDKLFSNAADLKIALSKIVMHLEPEWRTVIFRQLDALLDPNSWEDDSSLITKSTFMTFLRFVIYASPTQLPSLGVGHTGNVLAAWGADAKRIDVEFLPQDMAGATFVRQGAHSNEIFGWRGHVADLRPFIERNDMLECILAPTT
jgi:hypothetical protein